MNSSGWGSICQKLGTAEAEEVAKHGHPHVDKLNAADALVLVGLGFGHTV